LKELGVFVLAVILGSVGGLATSVLLGRWVGSAVASNAALAVAPSNRFRRLMVITKSSVYRQLSMKRLKRTVKPQ